MMQRLAPRSRWRHRLTRRPWIASRPVCPQREHTRRRRRSRTLTITPSTVKLTSITDAPDRRKSRLNAVVTRTSPSSQAAELEHPAACCEGGGVSSRSAQPPKEFSDAKRPLTRPFASGRHHRTARRPVRTAAALSEQRLPKCPLRVNG